MDLFQSALLEGVFTGKRASWALGSEEACQEGKSESQARRGRKGEGKGKVKLCEKQTDGTKIDGFK